MDDIEPKVAEIKRISILFGLKIICAESCTGGMLAASLTALPGASLFFDRGFVVYSNDAKRQALGVKQETIELYGAVSKQAVVEMAFGAINNVPGACIAAAVSGVIGPDSVEGKAVGTVYFACVADGALFVREKVFQGDRARNSYLTTAYALDLILEAIYHYTNGR